jgi:hypothetical protein
VSVIALVACEMSQLLAFTGKNIPNDIKCGLTSIKLNDYLLGSVYYDIEVSFRTCKSLLIPLSFL